MFQPPKHLLQARKTAARDQEVDHNSHQTRGEEEDKDDNKEARVGHSPRNLWRVESLFLLTSPLELCPSILTTDHSSGSGSRPQQSPNP